MPHGRQEMTAQLTREASDPHTLYNQMFDPLELVTQAAGTVLQNKVKGQHAYFY